MTKEMEATKEVSNSRERLADERVLASRTEWEDYIDDEEAAHTNCPQCSRHYDEIDHEYQCCSKCGWDAKNECWGSTRMPSDSDFMNGDADLLTGEWR